MRAYTVADVFTVAEIFSAVIGNGGKLGGLLKAESGVGDAHTGVQAPIVVVSTVVCIIGVLQWEVNRVLAQVQAEFRVFVLRVGICRLMRSGRCWLIT
jgi:hypothetical protein